VQRSGLARALEVGLAGLRRDNVRQRDAELEDLFAVINRSRAGMAAYRQLTNDI
jgi:hypothetical protein